MLLVLLLLLPGLRSEEPSPASLRTARYINNLWYEPVSFRVKDKAAKKGPVLFPNDGPPSPPTPLIVTSRPLIESIQRSELNPNNTVQASSQLNQVTYRPNYLDTDKDENTFVYVPKPTPVYQYVNVPFNDVQPRRQDEDLIRGFVDASEEYSSYYRNNDIGRDDIRDTANEYTQQRSTLPPIYKVFADHANNELTKQKKLDTKPIYEQQNEQPHYANYRQKHHLGKENSEEYNNHGENYAFSYSVKDHKTGDDFSHSQSSSGSATNGEYRVRLPDGRMQIVSYTADEGGYKADVRYDDEDSTTKNKIESEPTKVNQYQNDYIDNRYLDNLDNRYTQYNPKFVITPTAKSNNYKKDGRVTVDYFNKAGDQDTINDYLLTDTDKVDLDYKFVSNIDNDRNAKQSNIPDYYQYSDELIKDPVDYSSETLNYQPHKSKYSLFNQNNDNGIKSTVTPSYEEIKHLFTTPNPLSALVETGNPYSTIEPLDSRNEKVVVIGTKKPLFTNIRNIFGIGSTTPATMTYSTPAPIAVSSPSSYLYSTIANLKNKINLGKKPILSKEYLNKINKYLQFNK